MQAKRFYLMFPGICLGFALLLLGGVHSCGNLGQLGFEGNTLRVGANITPIKEVKSLQDKNTTVYVSGKVQERVPLLGRQAYQISDSTGTIWVVTNQTGLEEGDQIVIKGKIVYKSIPLAGKEYGEVYIEEQ
jgi:uncharacterized protein YdeI (BOF family)